MTCDRDNAGRNCLQQDRPGKVFLVLSNLKWQRQCMVCDAVFDSTEATASHAQSICFPAKVRTLN